MNREHPFRGTQQNVHLFTLPLQRNFATFPRPCYGISENLPWETGSPIYSLFGSNAVYRTTYVNHALSVHI